MGDLILLHGGVEASIGETITALAERHLAEPLRGVIVIAVGLDGDVDLSHSAMTEADLLYRIAATQNHVLNRAGGGMPDAG